ncbi:hypothetical protein Rleg4DRAFT_4724 [Rhizobium leguminosarum bv. trifolii WSM2297]|uniref:Uncharacterized protein n=1 Tax=Rhizobium leguminosarum bv. trifolii WSM2297 TaxID=754762 RepID=J0WB40_RHILT|nr:hypothetical protein Rleg4DRAFT_4724 [Rhizobium leguminosarum bv. trifolii WSM2297]
MREHSPRCSITAGSQPKGAVNPHALKKLVALGYPSAGFSSKSWDVFASAFSRNRLHYARQGESAIRAIVVEIVRKVRPFGQHKFFFGALGRWLRSNSKQAEFAELLELFQERGKTANFESDHKTTPPWH